MVYKVCQIYIITLPTLEFKRFPQVYTYKLLFVGGSLSRGDNIAGGKQVFHQLAVLSARLPLVCTCKPVGYVSLTAHSSAKFDSACVLRELKLTQSLRDLSNFSCSN